MKGITVEYALKVLAKSKQKKKFMHKTKYGRELEQTYGYDRQAHEEEHQRIKDIPFNPMIHWK